MNYILWSLILFPLVTFQVSWAGNEGAAGGDGVLMGDKVYLLDFLESGIEEAPSLDAKWKENAAYPKVFLRVSAALAMLKNTEVAEGVALKLVEISQAHGVAAYLLLNILESFSWRLVNSSLLPIDDEDTGIEIPDGSLVQLAARSGFLIQISRGWWDQLSPVHRVGLIFHEIVFAGTQPEWFKSPSGEDYQKQLSAKARYLVGLWFSDTSNHPSLMSLLTAAIKDVFESENSRRQDRGPVVELNSFEERNFDHYPIIRMLWAGGVGSYFDYQKGSTESVCKIPPWKTLTQYHRTFVYVNWDRETLTRKSFTNQNGKKISYIKIDSTPIEKLLPSRRDHRNYTFEMCMEENAARITGFLEFWMKEKNLFAPKI